MGINNSLALSLSLIISAPPDPTNFSHLYADILMSKSRGQHIYEAPVPPQAHRILCTTFWLQADSGQKMAHSVKHTSYPVGGHSIESPAPPHAPPPRQPLYGEASRFLKQVPLSATLLLPSSPPHCHTHLASEESRRGVWNHAGTGPQL